MRIAISTDGDSVSAHFGRCPLFTIVDLEDGKVAKKEVVENPGHQPGFIPQFLHQRGVECIVCGGMGRRAIGFFNELNIQAIIGVTGKIDDALMKIENGTLEGGESLCKPGAGRGYGLEKNECDHPEQGQHNH